MDTVLPIALLVIGVALGAVGAWLLYRIKIPHERDRAKAEAASELAAAQAEISTANERVRSQERHIESQDQYLAELKAIRVELEEKLNAEGKGRSAAEQEIKRIGPLEVALFEKNARVDSLQSDLTALKEQRSVLETSLKIEREKLNEHVALLSEAQQKLSDAFKALASEALKTNNTSFLELAKATLENYQTAAKGDLEQRQKSIDELVKPVKESLEKVDSKIQEIEKVRVGAYESMKEQVGKLIETQNQLRSETSKLVSALGTPNVRGRWGEMQLRRVVELAGMLEYCDFDTQRSVTTEDGRLRPDMIVKLPGGKNIVVDAKAPLGAYLEALEARDDEQHLQKMRQHSVQVRAHMTSLCEKQYWSQFEPTPEFVFLFLPGDIFYSAALQHDPALIEYGVDKRVILATPTTLIALLWAVAYGWKQEDIAANAQQISELGKELYKRISVLGSYFDKLGKSLDNAVKHYNEAVASLESNVLVGARRFKDLKTAPEGREISELAPIERSARALMKPELFAGVEAIETVEDENVVAQ